jgi:hypothetical protein
MQVQKTPNVWNAEVKNSVKSFHEAPRQELKKKSPKVFTTGTPKFFLFLFAVEDGLIHKNIIRIKSFSIIF